MKKLLLGVLSAFGLMGLLSKMYDKGAKDYKDGKWIKTEIDQNDEETK